ncbi:MAG: hypothetical protein GX660_08010 [Clostridiaceae bacterium]|nr:hypothetical protein [Clostridiaceae bacterium]
MWMYTLLPGVINMSLTAGIVTVFVLLVRIPLKKAPKVFSYMLWAVVLFRLVCPVSFSSGFSLMGLLHTPAPTNGIIAFVPSDIVHTEYPQVDLPVPGLNEAINESLPQGEEQLAADPLEGLMAAATMLWLCGIAVMLVYSAVSLLMLRRKLVGAVRLQSTVGNSPVSNGFNNALSHKNIYLADHIPTPFVIGLIHPKIYLPSTLTKQEQSYVILHEQTHIRRFDHIIKMVAFLVLSLHWFNPLVWVAFLSFVKDMEMSCDERVLKEMGAGIKADYSASLLSLAAGRRLINGSPLAFGEGNIKDRIKNVLDFRKPASWVIAVSIILVLVLTIGFAANRADDAAGGEVPEDTVYGKTAMDTPSDTPEGTQPGKQEETPSAPELSPGQIVGADMAEIDYASNDIVIFHGYFGLFVFDLNSGKILRSIDLKPIGCNATQGDDYCDVTVSADGKTVQLHPMSSKNMYVYSVLDNTLEKTAYVRMENRFADFVDIVDVVGLENAGLHSHSAVKFNTGGYGYLHTSDSTLGTLTYVRDDMVYKLFSLEVSMPGEAYPLPTTDLEQSISNAILSYYAVDKSGHWHETAGEGHITFGTEEKGGLTYAYIWERYARLAIENSILTEVSGHANPAVIVFEKDNKENYIFKELIRPNDGKGYRQSLEKIFPTSALKKLDNADKEKTSKSMETQIEAQARAYLKKNGRDADIRVEIG